jgi:hypothetical protein
MEKRSTRPHAQARKRSDEPPSGTFRHPLLRRREVVTCAEYGHPRWALPDPCVARDVRDRRRGTPSGRPRARPHRLTQRLGRDVPAETTTRRRVPQDDRWQLVPLAMHRSMYVWSVAGAHPLLNPP